MPQRLTSQNGFTLVEVIVSMVLVGIIVAIAAFSFKDVIFRNQVSTTANELVGALNYARSEAVTRSVPVSICRSADGATCATSGAYTQGWIIFADVDADGVVDAGVDTVIRVYPATSGKVTVVGNTNVAAHVTFLASGFLDNTTNNGTITTSSTSTTKAVAVVIGPTGRVRVQ